MPPPTKARRSAEERPGRNVYLIDLTVRARVEARGLVSADEQMVAIAKRIEALEVDQAIDGVLEIIAHQQSIEPPK